MTRRQKFHFLRGEHAIVRHLGKKKNFTRKKTVEERIEECFTFDRNTFNLFRIQLFYDGGRIYTYPETLDYSFGSLSSPIMIKPSKDSTKITFTTGLIEVSHIAGLKFIGIVDHDGILLDKQKVSQTSVEATLAKGRKVSAHVVLKRGKKTP